MKIVIDIDEISREQLFDIANNGFDVPIGLENIMMKSIVNGTPLPKNHGRLIDADEAKENMMYAMCGTGYQTKAMNVLNEYNTPTIIEADKEEEE